MKPGVVVADGEMLPGGSVRLPAGTRVTDLPGLAEGDFWVQDAAAAWPARLLAAQPGERVADLCAAPGGKAAQLALAGAQVFAVDSSEKRLPRLRENLARLRLAAEIVCADALTWMPDAPLDAVLLDAPCSATGTIRRHPDLPHVKQAGDLPALIAGQDRLLAAAAAMLRPGGRLVYAVCSLQAEEGVQRAHEACTVRVGAGAVQPRGDGRDCRGAYGGGASADDSGDVGRARRDGRVLLRAIRQGLSARPFCSARKGLTRRWSAHAGRLASGCDGR